MGTKLTPEQHSHCIELYTYMYDLFVLLVATDRTNSIFYLDTHLQHGRFILLPKSQQFELSICYGEYRYRLRSLNNLIEEVYWNGHTTWKWTKTGKFKQYACLLPPIVAYTRILSTIQIMTDMVHQVQLYAQVYSDKELIRSCFNKLDLVNIKK